MGSCCEPKEYYRCNRGHRLEWKGCKYIFKDDMICDKCGKYSNLYHPIRWKCPKCNLYFCSLCYDNKISEVCPVGHAFQLIRSDDTNYVCDKCYGRFPKDISKFSDIYCNITYCTKCFYDHVQYTAQNKT